MTEETEVSEDSLAALKRRADMMGVKYHPNISEEKLASRIDDKLNDKPAAPEETPKAAAAPVEKTQAQKNAELKRKATALVRINIACMNPMKSDWEGEIFSTGNKVVGTMKKYVPFNTDWHVPRMVYNMIKQRKCQVFYTIRNPVTGEKSRKGKLINEFTVSELPPLSEREMKDLAQRQAMAGGTAE